MPTFLGVTYIDWDGLNQVYVHSVRSVGPVQQQNSAQWWLVELTSPNTFFSCPAQCTVHLPRTRRFWTRRTKLTPTTTSTMNGKIWTSKSGVKSRAIMYCLPISLKHKSFPIIAVIIPETAALLENVDLAPCTVARNRACSRIPRASLLLVLPFHRSSHCLQPV